MNLTLTKGALYQLSYEGTNLLPSREVSDLMWTGQDSNLRRLPPGNLQSPPFAARDTDPYLIVNHPITDV